MSKKRRIVLVVCCFVMACGAGVFFFGSAVRDALFRPEVYIRRAESWGKLQSIVVVGSTWKEVQGVLEETSPWRIPERETLAWEYNVSVIPVPHKAWKTFGTTYVMAVASDQMILVYTAEKSGTRMAVLPGTM